MRPAAQRRDEPGSKASAPMPARRSDGLSSTAPVAASKMRTSPSSQPHATRATLLRTYALATRLAQVDLHVAGLAAGLALHIEHARQLAYLAPRQLHVGGFDIEFFGLLPTGLGQRGEHPAHGRREFVQGHAQDRFR